MKHFAEYAATNETAVTIGKFDGFHLGHQKLIKTIKEYASAKGLTTIVVSFNPHPAEVLKGGGFKTIFSRDEKTEILSAMGVDVYVEYPFTLEFSRIEPEKFANEIIFKNLKCKYLAVGENYRFGRNQSGTGDMLNEIAQERDALVKIVGNVTYNGEKVSSSLVRECITRNDFEKAEAFMGRPYHISGVVARGRQIGRTIGIPTLNINPQKNKLLPCDGVYVTKTHIAGKYLNSVTNIGRNPTISITGERTVETHLLDYDETVYGEKIRTDFKLKIRDTIKFDNVSQLREQIKMDIEFSKGRFK